MLLMSIHTGIRREKDYGDYPDVTAVPCLSASGNRIAVILGNVKDRRQKSVIFFFGPASSPALILLGWFGGRVFISSVITWQDAVICMFFPFAITGIGFFLTGIWNLWKRDGADERRPERQKADPVWIPLLGSGAVMILALALFSYVYWYIII